MERTGADGGYSFHGVRPGGYKKALAQSGTLGVYDATAQKIEIQEGDKLVRDWRQQRFPTRNIYSKFI